MTALKLSFTYRGSWAWFRSSVIFILDFCSRSGI